MHSEILEYAEAQRSPHNTKAHLHSQGKVVTEMDSEEGAGDEDAGTGGLLEGWCAGSGARQEL